MDGKMKGQNLQPPDELFPIIPDMKYPKKSELCDFNGIENKGMLPAPVSSSLHQDSANDKVIMEELPDWEITENDPLTSHDMESQHIPSKPDSNPGSPVDKEMPTLVPQIPLDKEESSPDSFSLCSMPVLKSSNAVTDPTLCRTLENVCSPKYCRLSMLRANCDSNVQTIQGVHLSEASDVKPSLTVIVDHNGVAGHSPENVSEPSPSTSDYGLSDAAIDGSPVDGDPQPCNNNLVFCKGQGLDGEHSPGFTLRESCDMSSLEGESSRPMLSPQEPRSVSSEVGNVRVADVFSGDCQEPSLSDPDSPPILESPSPRAIPELSIQAVDIAEDNAPGDVSLSHSKGGSLLTVARTNDASIHSPQLVMSACCLQDSGSDDLPQLTPFHSNASTHFAYVKDEETLSLAEELPELTPEEMMVGVTASPELSRALFALPTSNSSERSAEGASESQERPCSPAKSEEPQKTAQVTSQSSLSYSPLKTRCARGKKRKSYIEFYSDDEHASDLSDAMDKTFSPRAQTKRRKKGKQSVSKGRRVSQSQTPCSSDHGQGFHDVSSCNVDLDAFIEQTLEFDRVEAKVIQVMNHFLDAPVNMLPGTCQFYNVLREVEYGSQGEFSMQMESLSLGVDKADLQAVVMVAYEPRHRLTLLCRGMGFIMERVGRGKIAQHLFTNANFQYLEDLLNGIIKENQL